MYVNFCEHTIRELDLDRLALRHISGLSSWLTDRNNDIRFIDLLRRIS
ncbi:hypothetical protein [Parabacteroides sp.]|nr:hypothetical protein [Parabacteroides sp.]MDR3857998.1 hypothetical protein [Parabacteroides sp.]